MLWLFKSAGAENSRNKSFQFWRQDNRPEELDTNEKMERVLDYIHMNPVKANIVDKPEHYVYSSARDYCGVQGLLNIEFLD